MERSMYRVECGKDSIPISANSAAEAFASAHKLAAEMAAEMPKARVRLVAVDQRRGYARAKAVLTANGWTVISSYKFGVSGPESEPRS